MFDRRRFLSFGIALGGPVVVSNQVFAKIASAPRDLPSAALFDSDEDSYWAEICKQFLIPEDEVFLNNGTVSSSPAPVLRAVFDAYNEIERLAPEAPEELSLVGMWSASLQPIPRPGRRICRLHPRRDRPRTRHGGHQLCR
jgi:isopenicillin-N epimerase